MILIRPLVIAATLFAWPLLSADAQTLELEECRINAGPAYPGIKARCGMLAQPLDPADPDGTIISLRVAVVPALSLEPALDAVVAIAGGPGQASTEFYASTYSAFEPLRRARDIVLLDQRGTGDSAKLDCDVDEDIVQGRLSDEQTRQAARDCLDALPYDPRFFTTSVAVQDLESLRVALGYSAFNVYGISYGTRVAQHYARRYPESTRSVILDGVVPPQMALGPAIATEAQKALEAIFARCREDSACGNAFPELNQRFVRLKQSLAVQAVSVTLPHPVTARLETVEFGADELATAVRLLSYHPSTVALIPFLLDQASRGNYAPLASQFLSISSSLSDSLSIGMHNAVACTEDAPFFDGEGVSNEELSSTYIGPVLLDALRNICAVWPQGVIDDDFKEPLNTDTPVLLLSGEADPITPPEYAGRAAVDLERAYLHTGALQGHGLAPRGCVPDVMADFVETPEENPLDNDCLSRQFAMPFFLDFAGPSP